MYGVGKMKRTFLLLMLIILILLPSCAADTRLFGTFGAGSYTENDPHGGLSYHSGYDGIGYTTGNSINGGTWAQVRKSVYFSKDCNVDIKVHSSYSGSATSRYLAFYVDGSSVESWQLTSFYHTVHNVPFTEGNHIIALRFGMSGASYNYASYASNQHWEITDLTLLNGNHLIYGLVNDTDNNPLNSVTVTVDGSSVSTDATGYYQIITAAGTHTITASKSGYTTNSSSITVAASDVEYNIQLSDTSTLDGYVTNNLGDSISSTSVLLSNGAGSDTSNITGYYNIFNIDDGTYTITATAANHEDYSDTVSITTDITKNIVLTYINPESTLVIAVPPTTLPTIMPTPGIVIEPPKLTIIEQIMTLISASWLPILFAYIGAFLAKLIADRENDSLKKILADVAIYGTPGWILVLIVNLFINIISVSELFSIAAFFSSGFIISLIMNLREFDSKKKQ